MGDIDYMSMAHNGLAQLLTFAQSINPDEIEKASALWRNLQSDIPEAYETFNSLIDSVFQTHWTGSSSEAARAAAIRLSQGMNENVTRVAEMNHKLTALTNDARTVKAIAEWAIEESNKKGSSEHYQEIGETLAKALQNFYGPQGQDRLGELVPFTKVGPLTFPAGFEQNSGTDDPAPKHPKAEPPSENGAPPASATPSTGDSQGAAEGSPGGGSPAGGAGMGMGDGTAAAADLGTPDLGASELSGTLPMSSELDPMDEASLAGGGGGGFGGGGGIGGLGDKEKKLPPAASRVESSSKPVVNVNTPEMRGMSAQHGMMGGGMGGMGHGAGAGSGDKEYKTPDYLINNDHGYDLIGVTLPEVSPEVIGELDSNEIKRMEGAREKMLRESS